MIGASFSVAMHHEDAKHVLTEGCCCVQFGFSTDGQNPNVLIAFGFTTALVVRATLAFSISFSWAPWLMKYFVGTACGLMYFSAVLPLSKHARAARMVLFLTHLA